MALLGTPYEPTQAEMAAGGGAVFIAWGDVIWGSVSFTCMRVNNPDMAAGEPWAYSSPPYVLPVSEGLRAVTAAEGLLAYKIYVATTKHVCELTVAKQATDPAYWQVPRQDLTVIQLPPPVPAWSNVQAVIGAGLAGVEIATMKLDPDTHVLGVLYTYGVNSYGFAGVQINPEGGFDGTSAGQVLFDVQGLPPITMVQEGSKQKPGPSLAYQTHGVNEEGEFDNSGAFCIVDISSGSWEVFGDGYETMQSTNRKNADGTPYVYAGEPAWYNLTIDPDAYVAYQVSGSTAFDPTDGYKYGPSLIRLGGATGGKTVALRDFIVWAGVSSGYDSSHISVSGLDDVLVYGAALTADTDLESLLDSLSVVYDFEFYNGGDYMRVVANSQTAEDTVQVAGTYDVSQLLPTAPDKTITTTRLPPDKVAGSVAISYFDYNADFTQMSQSYTRDTYPVPSQVDLGQAQSINVPIVMDASDAATAALRAAYRAGSRNITNQFMLPWPGISHEPTDVVKLVVGEYEYLVQLNEVTINGDLSVSFGGTNYAAKFRGSVDAAASAAPPVASTNITRSRVVLIDAPSIVRGENLTYLKAYAMVIPAFGGVAWKGATAYRSIGAEDPENIGLTTRPGAHMVTTGVPVEGVETLFTDRESVLTVRLGAGQAPASCTEAQMLAGTNYCLFGDTGRWEYISFANVVQLDAQTFQLSTLLRGQNGTEGNVNKHLLGDLIIPLTDFSALEIDYAPGDIGKPLVVMASNAGAQSVADTDRASTVLTGASQKPFAPTAAQYANVSGDAVITWDRRDRFYVELPDDAPETVPMSEAFEAYEVDIYKSDGTVARTLKVSAPTCTYTAADIAADGNAIGAGIHVAIYQMSAVVGRGYALNRVIYDV